MSLIPQITMSIIPQISLHSKTSVIFAVKQLQQNISYFLRQSPWVPEMPSCLLLLSSACWSGVWRLWTRSARSDLQLG